MKDKSIIQLNFTWLSVSPTLCWSISLIAEFSSESDVEFSRGNVFFSSFVSVLQKLLKNKWSWYYLGTYLLETGWRLFITEGIPSRDLVFISSTAWAILNLKSWNIFHVSLLPSFTSGFTSGVLLLPSRFR